MSQKTNPTTRVLAAIGKLAIGASLFPYQITVNRKEHAFGMRSILLSVKAQRKENDEGKKSTSLTLNIPGFVFGDAKKTVEKHVPKGEKKKRTLFFKKKKEDSEN